MIKMKYLNIIIVHVLYISYIVRVLFDMKPNGEVTQMYHLPDLDQEILFLHKSLLGILSNKLSVSEELYKEGKPWSYTTTEKDHAGETATCTTVYTSWLYI